MAAHPSAEFEANRAVAMPNVQDLDVTVLAFAQWLSEMRSRSNASLQQMLAEMGIIRNGITSNNTDLTEFKRNTATVQQQMQSQISDLRDKLADAYSEIANIKKSKSQFEQELHSEYSSLSEQLQFKTLEIETLKKAYSHTHQQMQQQILQLQTEVNELRMRGDDHHRQTHVNNEQNVGKMGEVEMATQYANTELKRLRTDHAQAIANLSENMNRWNETLRDLSKEFHDFQKVMNVNQQKVQNSMWEMQARVGLIPAAPSGGQPSQATAPQPSDSSADLQRSPMGLRQVASSPGSMSQPMRSAASMQAAPRRAGNAQPQPMAPCSATPPRYGM